MAFRFPLEALLRVRQGLERQRELLLQEANLKVAMLRQQIADTNCEMENIQARQQPHFQSGLRAAELQFDVLCRAVLMERRGELEKQQARAEVLQRSRNDFQQARRQREIIDSLRRHQLEIYRQHEVRQDQRRVDDLFLLRRAYLKRG
jgi:flagellar export protein FliJ